jgi:ceramide glucosyltransferase
MLGWICWAASLEPPHSRKLPMKPIEIILLVIAAAPLAYYAIAIFSTWRFFRAARNAPPPDAGFTPAVSNLKPIRGADPDAYANFASFCCQDYPDYELLFCVSDRDDPALPVIEDLRRAFPERQIRVLYGSGRDATNDKVAKLDRLVAEAAHPVLVISDSDVRVGPDYLRTVVAALADPKVGATTCFYVTAQEKTFADRLHSTGMLSDFYAGIIVAWQLDGVKFALGPSIATTRERLAGFGGYRAIENLPGDDLLVGRLIAEQGYEVKLLPYTVETVADFASMRELIHKRLRWMVVMRHMRPAGHFGLLFTQATPWLLAAAVFAPARVALAYWGTYLCLRWLLTWMIAVWGLHQPGVARKLWLVPLWDAVAFGIWAASFTRRTLRWRGQDYTIRNGALVPAATRE